MKQQQQEEEETFDPNKMLRKRRFLRKSMANFHFDKVLSSRHRETESSPSPTLKTRSKSNVFWNLFTTRNQMNNVNKRIVTKREKNLIKATPWLERVAAMRFFNLGKDHPRTQKVVQHLVTCYQETRRHEDARALTKSPTKYLYNLRQDLRVVHGDSMKPVFITEEVKKEKEEETKSTETSHEDVVGNDDMNRPQSMRSIKHQNSFHMTAKFRDLLRRARDRRAVSSHAKLRRPVSTLVLLFLFRRRRRRRRR